MKQTSGSTARARTAVKRPPMAMKAQGDGHALPEGPEAEASHAMRIHEVAYALYEARGCVDGHALEDWLAAEAAVSADGHGTRSSAGDH
ncbi:MAG: DUF2934 domain-containing protein [Hydrogenophaga sp.]|jgi:hypothetical protein|uniref:DUF2934 domain-containing protein n=1 Tax=Hydrogenophaga sp. TaxID=1904254 RepID=UPI0025C26EFB|nr:DUF2934 domain-containing protein [Hydrogenophaga sp.]MDP2249977.1 DUF2934 domain-containing protein [Hydrogenophaga sp.]MDZ4126941.1 DUF2934 domain-containing protein [Hydrogenophaga sp.]MDZ4399321.1 DUF2934 domain-containing protein [Hydrogenophaga sp.]